MANTYVAIATVTVGSGGAATISFSSIPSTYNDLLISVSGRSTGTAATYALGIEPNGSTSNLSERYLLHNASGLATSGSDTLGYIYSIPGGGSTSSTFGNMSIYIPNYASSNNKSISIDAVTENNATTNVVLGLTAMLWSNSSAISSITLRAYAGGGTGFAQYSTATLYGIKNS